jgi:hypothetical protein
MVASRALLPTAGLGWFPPAGHIVDVDQELEQLLASSVAVSAGLPRGRRDVGIGTDTANAKSSRQPREGTPRSSDATGSRPAPTESLAAPVNRSLGTTSWVA